MRSEERGERGKEMKGKGQPGEGRKGKEGENGKRRRWEGRRGDGRKVV